MTKFINTSGHGGPEWVLSSYGITERIKEILGESDSIEVYGISSSNSNIPTIISVSSSRGVDTLTFREMDAGVVENQIREHFGLNNLNVIEPDSEPEVLSDDIEFIASSSFENQVDEVVRENKKSSGTKKEK